MAFAEFVARMAIWEMDAVAGIEPSPPPPTAVAFLGKDMALSSGQRLPFVRDDAGRVGWVETGFRLVPRTAAS